MSTNKEEARSEAARRESPADALFAAVDIEVAQQTKSVGAKLGSSVAAPAGGDVVRKSTDAQANDKSRAADSAAPTASGSVEEDTRSADKLAPAFGDVPPRKRKRAPEENGDEANSGGSEGEKVAKKVSDEAVQKAYQAMRSEWEAQKQAEAAKSDKPKESGITPVKAAGEEVVTVSDSDPDSEADAALTAEQVAATPAEQAREAWVKERASRIVAQESLRKNKKWIKQALVTLSNVRTRLYDLEGEINKQKAGRLEAQETNAKLARQAQRFRTQITDLETKLTEAKQLQQHCVKQMVGEQEAAKSASAAWKEVKAQLAVEEQNRKKAVSLLRNSERLLSLAYAKLGPEKVRELTKEAGTVSDSSPGKEGENGSSPQPTINPPAAPTDAKEEPHEKSMLMEELQQRLREERAARMKVEKELEDEQLAHRLLRGAHKDAVNQLAKQADLIQAMRHSASRSQASYGYSPEQFSPVTAMAQEESLRRRERLEMLHKSQGRSYGLPEEYMRERESRLRSTSPRSAAAEQVFNSYLAEHKVGSSRGQKRGSIDDSHHDWDSVMPGRIAEEYGRHHSLHGLRDSYEDGLRRNAEAEFVYGLASRASSGRLYTPTELRDRREPSKYADV